MRSVVEPQIEQVNQRKPRTKYEQGCFFSQILFEKRAKLVPERSNVTER